MIKIETDVHYDNKYEKYTVTSRVYYKDKSYSIRDEFIPFDKGIFDYVWEDIGNYLKDILKEESKHKP